MPERVWRVLRHLLGLTLVVLGVVVALAITALVVYLVMFIVWLGEGGSFA